MLNKLKRAALGAHTPHDKATAASKPVPMPLPAQVRILMSQHIGAPAKALVKKGDEVFVGTKIGEAGGFVSANIHSSVSGTVAAVEPFRLSNGRMCDSVDIKTAVSYTHLDVYKRQPLVGEALAGRDGLIYRAKARKDFSIYYKQTKFSERKQRGKRNICLLYTSRCV